MPSTDEFTLDAPLRRAFATPAGRLSLTAWLEYAAPDQRRAVVAAWRAVAEDGREREQQFTLETPGGPRRLLSRARRQPGGDAAAVTMVSGVLLDVTATASRAEQTEARARLQHERLRLIQEVGRLGSFEWCPNEDSVDWSPELERLYDLNPGTFGNSVAGWAEHVHPEDAAAAAAHVQECMARREDRCEVEFRARLPTGEHRWLAARIRVMYRPDGTPSKVIGVTSDIDARKRSEEALRDSGSWFRHLADALPILVWAARPDGVLDYVNEPWRRYTGDIEPAEWDRAVHPDDVTQLRERWQESLRRREPFEARCRLRRRKDGVYRWHSLRAVPVCDPSGVLMRWLGAFVDDHEFRMLVGQNQALLASEQRARQAAEDAGRMKDEFLATLGHELRTPLNAITGWTSLLKRGGLSDDDTAKAIDVIERSAQAQRHLIDELLDVSRVISGHVRLDLQPVFVEDVVTHAIEAIRPIVDAKSLHLDTALEPGPPITGDPARLQQVFANLLGNAVKFTPPGGRITVGLDRVGDDVRVRVADRGVGIPGSFLPYVFDRFRQADSPSVRRFGGLGLGLSIVRQIVHMHGGRVEATSAGEGEGAEFTVLLGVGSVQSEEPASGSAAGARPADNSASPLRGLSMLIIEDDPDSREILSVLLENAGAVPVAAATVTDALRLLGDLEVDVVLSDIGMPERDGFDLIRALRSFPNPRVRNAPALAVTAFARQEDRERILAAGFDGHVSKPVEPQELFGAVVEVSRRRASALERAPESPPGP